MTIAIYYRISTADQSLDMQKLRINTWLADNHPEAAVKIYKDIGISGASTKRPGYIKLLKDIEKKKITHLVVYKLDRLSRSAANAIRLILRLDELECLFTATSQPMLSSGTPFRHAIIAIFAELAQMEREMIVDRVTAGLDAARKRGVVLGPKIQITEEIKNKIKILSATGLSQAKIAKEVGFSVGAINKVLRGKYDQQLKKPKV